MSKGDKPKESTIKQPNIVKPKPNDSYVKYLEECESAKPEVSSR